MSKKKIVLIILSVLIIAAVIFGIVLLINPNIFNNLQPAPKEITTKGNYSVLYAAGTYDNTNRKSNDIKSEMLAIINGSGKVVDILITESGYSQGKLQEEETFLKGFDPILYNVRIEDGKLHYNKSALNGKTKDELIKLYENDYRNLEITYIK